MNLVDHITLCEVGPRDGLQNERRILTVQEKQELIEAAADAGFPVIEVGSFMSPKAVPQMADTDEVFTTLLRREGVEYRALIANLKGVERAAACGCKKVKLNVSASKAHNLANLNRTPAESVAGFGACVDAARSAGIEISGSISMAFGSPWDREIPLSDVKEIVNAYLAVGIHEISLSDASGQAYPTQVYSICTEMAKAYPQVTWWLHFHNTRGLGIANILAGMQAGFTRYDSAFAGVGGCRSSPARPETWRPRTCCTCATKWASRPGSISIRRWRSAAASCRSSTTRRTAICCAPESPRISSATCPPDKSPTRR